jgi:hypothetical protein
VDDFYKMSPRIEQHMRCPKLTNALTELLGPDFDAYQVRSLLLPVRRLLAAACWRPVHVHLVQP